MSISWIVIIQITVIIKYIEIVKYNINTHITILIKILSNRKI